VRVGITEALEEVGEVLVIHVALGTLVVEVILVEGVAMA
jgi:hypothetical protein